MRVRLLSPMFLPQNIAVIEPVGKTVEVPDEMAKDWIARGLAESVTPAPVPVQPPHQKGRR